MEKGHLNRDVSALILANTRTPVERHGDLMAQVGANNYGAKNLEEFISRYGIEKFLELDHEILEHTKRMVTRRLQTLPKGTFTGSDVLEANGELMKIQVEIEITGNDKISVDFTGTSGVCKTNLNAPLAVTLSAVYFFFRTILGGDVPVNSAFYDFFDITVPEGSMINAPSHAPVVGGNVETSQRPQYDGTRTFYKRLGYRTEAVIQDFYAPGEGKVIFCKVLTKGNEAPIRIVKDLE